LTIYFDLTSADLISVQGARDRRRSVRLLWLAVGAALLAFVTAGSAGIALSAATAVASLTGILAAATILWILPAVRRVQVRRDFDRYPQLRGPVSYTFAATHVTFTTGGSEVKLPWSTFTGVREDAEYVYLDGGSAASYFLPKRVLGQDEIEALRSLIASALPVSAVRAPSLRAIGQG
jgi:hypothetical protein